MAGERHFARVQRLTEGERHSDLRLMGGAIWAASRRKGFVCEQIFRISPQGEATLRSSGLGYARAPTAWGEALVFASTATRRKTCPLGELKDDARMIWLDPDSELMVAEANGRPEPLFAAPGSFDGFAAASDKGGVLFTSTRDGDADLYHSPDRTTVPKRIVARKGFDGQAAWAPDGARFVVVSRPDDAPASPHGTARGQVLLDRSELFWGTLAGELVQLTDLDAVVRDPVVSPDGRFVYFASNVDAPQSDHFAIYRIGADGSGLRRLTFHLEGRDLAPAIDATGKRLAFASDRGGRGRDLYMATLGRGTGAPHGGPVAKKNPHASSKSSPPAKKVSLGTMPGASGPGGKGVVLRSVRAASPAARAGLQPGDVLLKLGGVEIGDLTSMMRAIEAQRAGESAEAEILRDGKKMTLKITF